MNDIVHKEGERYRKEIGGIKINFDCDDFCFSFNISLLKIFLSMKKET